MYFHVSMLSEAFIVLAAAPAPPPIFGVRDLILAGLALLSALFILLVRTTGNQALNSIKTQFESQQKDLATLQSDMAKHEEDIESLNKEINNMRVEIAQNLKTKDACKVDMDEQKAYQEKLEASLHEMDKVTRKMELLLSKINGAVQNMLES